MLPRRRVRVKRCSPANITAPRGVAGTVLWLPALPLAAAGGRAAVEARVARACADHPAAAAVALDRVLERVEERGLARGRGLRRRCRRRVRRAAVGVPGGEAGANLG